MIDNYIKYLNLLATDHLSKFLVMATTFRALEPEIVKLKGSDHTRIILYEDFRKILKYGTALTTDELSSSRSSLKWTLTPASTCRT